MVRRPGFSTGGEPGYGHFAVRSRGEQRTPRSHPPRPPPESL
jgi:hypothetical protein